ncbi:MAG: response regulator, partial [Planctomycetales bacterium]
IIRTFVRIAMSLGYECRAAHDGVEALAACESAERLGQPFHVVVMDLTIPGGMGGKEAVKRLNELAPDVHVIASSGYSNDPVMANYGEFGFAGILAKPYKIEDVSEILNKTCGAFSR